MRDPGERKDGEKLLPEEGLESNISGQAKAPIQAEERKNVARREISSFSFDSIVFVAIPVPAPAPEARSPAEPAHCTR